MSPAYDLLPTQLLLPEDQEESALTINGKKRRLNKKDFISFAQSLMLNDKQITNVFARFSDNLTAAFQTIEKGHCSPNMKNRYNLLLKERGKSPKPSIMIINPENANNRGQVPKCNTFKS